MSQVPSMLNQIEVPQTMRAWVAFGAGHVKYVLEFKTDWPTPMPPKAGEIMIRVSYVAINPGDAKMIVKPIPFRKTAIIGMDFAGEVIQVGPSTPDLRLGMIVAGTIPMANILRGVGSLAEYLVVPAHAVVEKPNGLDERVAAGLLGVCSARNESLVRKLGAQEVVDYAAHENLYDHLSSLTTSTGPKPFDAIFDCVGDDTLYYRSPGYLKVDGKYHSIERGPLGFISQFKFNHWPVLLGGIPRIYSSVFSNPTGSSAREVVNLFEKGYIKEVPVDSVFEIDDVLKVNHILFNRFSIFANLTKAFEMSATKRTVGKILIKVKQGAAHGET
ncbi:hypothetical protein CHU98_g10627 [Xylaria longipes]|nr:hypothetical protein CHU98_g10627 [Xylaria longipes]